MLLVGLDDRARVLHQLVLIPKLCLGLETLDCELI